MKERNLRALENKEVISFPRLIETIKLRAYYLLWPKVNGEIYIYIYMALIWEDVRGGSPVEHTKILFLFV